MPNAKLEQARSLFSEGKSLREIAGKVSLPEPQVARMLKAVGVVIEEPKPTPSVEMPCKLPRAKAALPQRNQRENAAMRREEIAAFIENHPDTTTRDLADKFEISLPLLHHDLRALGLTVKPPSKVRKITTERRARLAAHIEKHPSASWNELCKIFGFGQGSLSRDLQALGLTKSASTRTGGRPPKIETIELKQGEK